MHDFDATIHKSNLWLNELEEELGGDHGRALAALRATLHAIRDRLSVPDTAKLAAQLPTLVRGLFYEGWRPAAERRRRRSREDFLDDVADAMPAHPEVDPERAARAVFAVMQRHVSQGEIDHVKHALPAMIASLWPRVTVRLRPVAAAPEPDAR